MIAMNRYLRITDFLVGMRFKRPRQGVIQWVKARRYCLRHCVAITLGLWIAFIIVSGRHVQYRDEDFDAANPLDETIETSHKIPDQCSEYFNSSLIFITSITRPFRDHAEERNWKHTLWQNSEIQRQQGNERPPLWVFSENKWEVAHGRVPLNQHDLPIADCLVDVFEVHSTSLNDVTAVDAFYEIPSTPGLNVRIMDGKVLMRKVAAIAHALRVMRDGSVVIWVDVDVVPSRPLDDTFMNFVRAKDVSYLAETVCWRDVVALEGYASLEPPCLDFRVDTGIVAFTANRRTRMFTDWWLEAYSSKPGRMLALARVCFQNVTLSQDEEKNLLNFFVGKGSKLKSFVTQARQLCTHAHIRSNIGLNDIYTFALGLHAFGTEINQGWFAYKTSGCEEQASILPGGHCHACPATNSTTNRRAQTLISPFNAGRYMYHVKGGTAIMARQHTDRHEASIKRVRTTDVELLLPKSYFPTSGHIDHRLACGDKRGRYGSISSLKDLARVPSD